MASEIGVLDIPGEDRHQVAAAAGQDVPGRPRAGPHRPDDEIKASWPRAIRTRVAARTQIELEDLPDAREHGHALQPAAARPPAGVRLHQEELRILMRRWRATGEEPIGSMGTDTPIAALSDRPKLLFDYFKQNFAQVTNPPIDRSARSWS
jgi:glutamate synthase (NADPH/NADH) large chain